MPGCPVIEISAVPGVTMPVLPQGRSDMKKIYVEEPSAFSLSQEPEFYRLQVLIPHIEVQHVEEFLDITVEWLSSNPDKGILVDFRGVKSVCEEFSFHLNEYYETIKRRGLYVRFVNVAPSIELAVEVYNVTTVINLEDLTLNRGKTVVNARQMLEDLAARLSDQELMKKHKISRKGLESVFRQLLERRLIPQRFLARRASAAKRDSKARSAKKGAPSIKISSAEVVSDIAARLTNEELMQKYQLSPKSFSRLLQKLLDKGLLSESELTKRVKQLERK
jgi:CRP-like cAMP-binding protein